MRRKVLAVLVAALMVASSLILIGSLVGQSSTSSGITTDWLNQKLVEWHPNSTRPLDFAVRVIRLAHFDIYSQWNTDSVINTELGMLYSTNASTVRIEINYDPWLNNRTALISKYDRFISDIRANGKALFLADAAAEQYRQGKLPWEDFKKAWVARVETLAARYHPEFYEVVKEPGWYFGMISDFPLNGAILNATQWVDLAETLTSVVHQVSPNTKIGVAVPASDLYHEKVITLERDFLSKAVTLTGLDFVGFDIYNTVGFDDTQTFLSDVGSNGKQIWIAEAWSAGGPPTINDLNRTQLDAEWIRVLYYFALHIGAQGMIPFYTDIFASYDVPPDNSTQLLTFYQGRTSVFQEYRNIILGSPAPSNQTSTTTTSAGSSLTTSVTTSIGTSTALKPRQNSGVVDIEIILLVVVVTVVLIGGLFWSRRRRG